MRDFFGIRSDESQENPAIETEQREAALKRLNDCRRREFPLWTPPEGFPPDETDNTESLPKWWPKICGEDDGKGLGAIHFEDFEEVGMICPYEGIIDDQPIAELGEELCRVFGSGTQCPGGPKQVKLCNEAVERKQNGGVSCEEKRKDRPQKAEDPC